MTDLKWDIKLSAKEITMLYDIFEKTDMSKYPMLWNAIDAQLEAQRDAGIINFKNEDYVYVMWVEAIPHEKSLNGSRIRDLELYDSSYKLLYKFKRGMRTIESSNERVNELKNMILEKYG